MNVNPKPITKDTFLPERIIVLALSVFLCAGSAMLYARNSRPIAKITVDNNGKLESRTLFEIEKELKEARKVQINSAEIEEITLIPGIGPKIASRIKDYRDANGRFYTIESLLKVKGIGPAKLEKMKEYISIE
jgi:comEA protein